MTENPVDVIKRTWASVAPAGFGGNIHLLIQGEYLPDGADPKTRGIHYPALVFGSLGIAIERTPDGRRTRLTEDFSLDFRAETYAQARGLAEAFRKASDTGLQWIYEADDLGLDLIFNTGGNLAIPRRNATITLPPGPSEEEG